MPVVHPKASFLSSDQQHEQSLGISRSGSYSREASLADMGEYAVIRYAPYPTFQFRGTHDNVLEMLHQKILTLVCS
jgi:hypothetical protein